MPITVGGQTINRPGAYSQVDTSGMTPVSLGAFNVLGFVGEAPSIKAEADKTQVMYFNSPKVASETLGAGSLLDNLNTAWAHGADLIAVSVVVATDELAGVVDADWDTAIGRFETEFIDGIVAVSTEGAIQAKVDTHVGAMSTVKNKMERRAFYGHEAGLTATEVAGLVTTIQGERSVFASPAVYEFDASGSKVVKDSVLLASAYAGTWASQNPQEPITYKYVKFAGLEKRYRADEIETLLQAGIAVTEEIRGRGLRIVQGITTSQSEDLTQKELSVSTLKDVMSKNLRDYLEEKYVGTAGVTGIEVTIKNDVISLIEQFLKNGWISGYVEDAVVVEKNGTAFSVSWEGKPTLPINNFVITSHFTL